MQCNPILESYSVAMKQQKPKLEKHRMDCMEDGRFCLLRLQDELVQIAEYLDPPSRRNLMKAHDDTFRHLSPFYCAKHGTTISKVGLCQADVQDHIQRDGHDVQSFQAKLARRTEPVDFRDWDDAQTVFYDGILPLDFDPVYQKYFWMMKECEQCETEATDAAMAGIGLQRCITCYAYWNEDDIEQYCEECQFWRCNECQRQNKCHWCDAAYCSQCNEFKSCDLCHRCGCFDCMEVRLCHVCNVIVCFLCFERDGFEPCEFCDDILRFHHGFYCDECDNYTCKHCRDRGFYICTKKQRCPASQKFE